VSRRDNNGINIFESFRQTMKHTSLFIIFKLDHATTRACSLKEFSDFKTKRFRNHQLPFEARTKYQLFSFLNLSFLSIFYHKNGMALIYFPVVVIGQRKGSH